MGNRMSRRKVLQLGSIAGLGTLAACEGVEFPGINAPSTPAATPDILPPAPNSTSTTGFEFEIQRTDAQWRARLNEEEYRILRRGGTEPRHTSPLATENASGIYACKGCDLPIYSSTHKVILDRGWAFFRHSYENATMTAIDNDQIEAHCRRCGSHLGHILYVEREILHCINGSALTFTTAGG